MSRCVPKGSQIQGVPKGSQSRGIPKCSQSRGVPKGSQIQGVPKGSQIVPKAALILEGFKNWSLSLRDFTIWSLSFRNAVQHDIPVEKKTAKGVKRKVNDDYLHFTHYLDGLHSFQTFVCRQNLISSTAHSVRTVHQRKVGITALDTKRWLCADTIKTHSHGHKYTVEDTMALVNKSYITCTVLETVNRLTAV